MIVFIYGGGGTLGSSGMANYGGENMAKRGAIFVNFNYRVGMLGYMAHPELTAEQGGHSGNYGYLDQNAALKWVRDNIAAFGGDPGKVVITGQSFGAGAVAAQITSPLSKGLFRGAMMTSACNFGGSGMIGGVAPLADGEKAGLELQKRLGAADLAAMRNVPADRILALQEENQLGLSVPGVRAPAVIDGYFWTGTKEEAFASHQASDVPIIASSNGDDLDSARYPLTRARTVADYQAMARQMYGADADAVPASSIPVAGRRRRAADGASRRHGKRHDDELAQLRRGAGEVRHGAGLYRHLHAQASLCARRQARRPERRRPSAPITPPTCPTGSTPSMSTTGSGRRGSGRRTTANSPTGWRAA